jgi:hypothetical protein
MSECVCVHILCNYVRAAFMLQLSDLLALCSSMKRRRISHTNCNTHTPQKITCWLEKRLINSHFSRHSSHNCSPTIRIEFFSWAESVINGTRWKVNYTLVRGRKRATLFLLFMSFVWQFRFAPRRVWQMMDRSLCWPEVVNFSRHSECWVAHKSRGRRNYTKV